MSEFPDPLIEPYDGYIFDCDGTLVDSMPLHYQTWVSTLKSHGATFEFTEDLFYSYAGRKEEETVEFLNHLFGASLHPDAFVLEKTERFESQMNQLVPIKPVADYAIKLHQLGKPIAVASGSPKDIVIRSLEMTGLDALFSVIITPEDVEKGKPSPDMFLLAASRLQVSPERCLVLEDGENGIIGAHAAGMKTLFIPKTLR